MSVPFLYLKGKFLNRI